MRGGGRRPRPEVRVAGAQKVHPTATDSPSPHGVPVHPRRIGDGTGARRPLLRCAVVRDGSGSGRGGDTAGGHVDGPLAVREGPTGGGNGLVHPDPGVDERSGGAAGARVGVA
jgi:hypothetical protein